MKRFCVRARNCLVLAAVSVLTLSVSAELVMPQIVSHRGESIDRPENTLAAFRLAFERGVDGVECDVYATKDGVPVIIHDSTTGRTAGSGTNLTVAASTWDELKNVRVGAFGKWIGTAWEGETIPCLADYLALLSMNTTTKCIVELKGNGANGLVDAVVAAVKAQPLATKDRVVFIAFDAALVRDVRAKLPDYEAWFLLSGGTYTADSLLAQIRACTATGVDVLHTATFDAQAVAGVKEAGYRFAVWTCDDNAQALALAQKGVSSITTNRGGEMKAALAAAVASQSSRAEIVVPAFPAGLTRLDVGVYAQPEKLIVHFDGIRNAGADAPHDSARRTWKNLVPGAPDATIAGSGGFWSGHGFVFDGSSNYARLDSAVDLNHTTATIQLSTDVNLAEQRKGNSCYPNIFYSSDNDDFGFYLDNTKSLTSTLLWKVKAYRSEDRRPSIATWNGKYVTGIFESNAQYLFDGTTYANKQTCSKRTDKEGKRFSWMGSSTMSTRAVKGACHSLRIYNVALTPSDLAWNRLVDDARFRDAGTNGCVFVDSNLAGAHGTEANGVYYVNGHHTFTAPARVQRGPCTYALAGYKLERYDLATHRWILARVSTESSFSYTNCLADTGARVTWNWRLVDGVKKIDAGDYVQGGLVLHFDGKNNAGLDAAHDPAATTWKNLAEGPHATRLQFDTTLGVGQWTPTGYDLSGGVGFYLDSAVQLRRQATVHFAATYRIDSQIHKWPTFFGPGDSNVDKFNGYTYTRFVGAGHDNRGDHLKFNTGTLNGLSIGRQPWDGRLGIMVLDGFRAANAATEKIAWSTGSFKAEIGSHRYLLGAAHLAAANRQARAYKGMLHAFRLYDRVLTEEEIAHNIDIDKIRFYGGFVGTTLTNLVTVTASLPDMPLDDGGSWILRGESARKTFTAPETVTRGRCTYVCTGYRLETWDPTRQLWTDAVEISAVRAVDMTSALANRRLTWLYTIVSGIRSAADYDVHDYVQSGLVAHYDGLRNLGPGVEPTSLGMYWQDCSPRDVPMIAASNTAFTAWISKGHRFAADAISFFEPHLPLALGRAATVQAVLETDPTAQPAEYPHYFSFGFDDRGIFTRKKNPTVLEVKYPDWVGANLTVTNWTGRYLTCLVSPTHHHLFQGTDPGAGTPRTVFGDLPATTFSVGAPNTYPHDYTARSRRALSGDYYALRVYNRPLTPAELAHNRMVDEIRYRGVMTNANVTIVCEMPFDGVETPTSVPSGEYEVVGDRVFTAQSITVGETQILPRHTVETWNGTSWGAPIEFASTNYTYSATAGKVRVTWKWSDPREAVTAIWTGGGAAGDFLDPANWLCVNAFGETISARPTARTTVIIDGETSFTLPEGATPFPCKKIQIGAVNHTGLRLGVMNLVSNAGATTLVPGAYTLRAADDTRLSYLNGGDLGPNAAWQASCIAQRRARFDGWVNVTDRQAGIWTIRQAFDDYFAFAIDGDWVIDNNTHHKVVSAVRTINAGWHRFTIVCGDTGSAYGSTETSSILVDGEQVPLAISCGGETLSLTSGDFALGTAAPATVTLTADCDWSAFDAPVLADAVVLDLNGHNLRLSSIDSDFVGGVITNSNASVLSTVTFHAPEGRTVANNVTIGGNVRVVKTGAGVYRAAAVCRYTGGTRVEEGVAQPPDGNGADVVHCYDEFKAFGTNDIVIAANAVFDLRANYAYRDRIVLAGGTVTNGKADMTKTAWAGSGIGRLEADSTLLCTPYSVVFGDSNGHGDTDLGGYTLAVTIDGNGKSLYVRNSKITNGTIDVLAGGWIRFLTPCDARTVDFKLNCALDVGADISVRGYEALWPTIGYMRGSKEMKVYGTFKPAAHNNFYGCTLQDGARIDLSSRTTPLPLTAETNANSGRATVTFAPGARISVVCPPNGVFQSKDKLVTWTAETAPPADVVFRADTRASGRTFTVRRDDAAMALVLSLPTVIYLR